MTGSLPSASNNPLTSDLTTVACSSCWGPLWDQTLAAWPETKVWAGLSQNMDQRTTEVLRYLSAGGDPNVWIVSPNRIPEVSQQDHAPGPFAPRSNKHLDWHPPTEFEQHSPAYQALPLLLGLLVWAAWDDCRYEFDHRSDEAQTGRQKSVTDLRPVFSSSIPWWPPVWRRALADHVPPSWKALSTVPVGRVLWNDRFLNHPDRYTSRITQLPIDHGRSVRNEYIEGPVMGWFAALAADSRRKGLGLPTSPPNPYTDFWSRVHPNLWLDRSSGAVLASWLRGLDELSVSTSTEDEAALPSVVVLLEERDLLRGAIRLSDRPSGFRPVVPFAQPFLKESTGCSSSTGPTEFSFPADFLVDDLKKRLGIRGARTLLLSSSRTMLDEWCSFPDSAALIEATRHGWVPSNGQMRDLLRGLWSVRGSAYQKALAGRRELLEALAPLWWRAQPWGEPLAPEAFDVLRSSAALERSIPSAPVVKKPLDLLANIVLCCAPPDVLLRPLRAQEDNGAIHWPHSRSGVSYHPWLESRDDQVRLRRVAFAEPTPAAKPEPLTALPPSRRRL